MLPRSPQKKPLTAKDAKKLAKSAKKIRVAFFAAFLRDLRANFATFAVKSSWVLFRERTKPHDHFDVGEPRDPSYSSTMPVQRTFKRDLTQQIIGAAIKLHRNLGPGLLESAYEACLAYELEQLGFIVERQKAVPLIYRTVKLECASARILLSTPR